MTRAVPLPSRIRLNVEGPELSNLGSQIISPQFARDSAHTKPFMSLPPLKHCSSLVGSITLIGYEPCCVAVMANVQQIHPDFSSSNTATSTARIPMLLEDGSNWILYKEQFLAVVVSKKLRRYLQGTEQKPVPLTAPGVDPDADI
ncbi:hypothetical protein C8T65DRAFT_694889, partial [Cerioporus squamosus]